MPTFLQRTWGLRHRPELQHEAIGEMIEQLLREAQDPSEQFMTANFTHYLRCLCADNFNRVLRQEGLSFRRDSQGMPVGRPMHVPRALLDSFNQASGSGFLDDNDALLDVAAADDPIGERLAELEAERILDLIPDPIDRKIVMLRIIKSLKWPEIAPIIGKTDRTLRLRYVKTMHDLRRKLYSEAS